MDARERRAHAGRSAELALVARFARHIDIGLVGPTALERRHLRVLAAGCPRGRHLGDRRADRAVGAGHLELAARARNLSVDARAALQPDRHRAIGVDRDDLALFDRERARVVRIHGDRTICDLQDLADNPRAIFRLDDVGGQTSRAQSNGNKGEGSPIELGIVHKREEKKGTSIPPPKQLSNF